MGYETGGFQENKQEVNVSSEGTAKPWNNPYKKPGGGGFGFKKKPPRDFVKDPMFLYKPYFTYSNDNPPEEALSRFKEIVELLQRNGYTARCKAFKNTTDAVIRPMDLKWREVILPWEDFDEDKSKLTFTSPETREIGKMLFPGYEEKKKPVQYFISADIRLVSGQNLKSLAQFGLIWTPDGCESLASKTRDTGFAGNILTVAHAFRVPLFNVKKLDVKERLVKHLQLEHL